MARDNKKNAAYDSGIRGSERAPKPTASRGKEKRALLPNGATDITIYAAENGFIATCSWPPNDKDWSYTPPKPNVFTSAEGVAEFIETALKVDEKEK